MKRQKRQFMKFTGIWKVSGLQKKERKARSATPTNSIPQKKENLMLVYDQANMVHGAW